MTYKKSLRLISNVCPDLGKWSGHNSTIFDILHMYCGGPHPKPSLLTPQIGLMIQEIAHKTMSLWNSLAANNHILPQYTWYTSENPRNIAEAVALGFWAFLT